MLCNFDNISSGSHVEIAFPLLHYCCTKQCKNPIVHESILARAHLQAQTHQHAIITQSVGAMIRCWLAGFLLLSVHLDSAPHLPYTYRLSSMWWSFFSFFFAPAHATGIAIKSAIINVSVSFLITAFLLLLSTPSSNPRQMIAGSVFPALSRVLNIRRCVVLYGDSFIINFWLYIPIGTEQIELFSNEVKQLCRSICGKKLVKGIQDRIWELELRDWLFANRCYFSIAGSATHTKN